MLFDPDRQTLIIMDDTSETVADSITSGEIVTSIEELDETPSSPSSVTVTELVETQRHSSEKSGMFDPNSTESLRDSLTYTQRL
jgi:hypothetical protein